MPREITEDMEKKYLESGGTICPFCGNDDITGGFVEVDSGSCHQPVKCSNPDCNESWRDVYNLAGIEND